MAQRTKHDRPPLPSTRSTPTSTPTILSHLPLFPHSFSPAKLAFSTHQGHGFLKHTLPSRTSHCSLLYFMQVSDQISSVRNDRTKLSKIIPVIVCLSPDLLSFSIYQHLINLLFLFSQLKL